MSDLLAYLGPSWRDEALKRLQSELTPEKMNNVTTSMSNIKLPVKKWMGGLICLHWASSCMN